MEKSIHIIELKKELLDLESKIEKNPALKIAGFDAKLLQSSINIMVGFISSISGVILLVIGLDYIIFGIGLIVVAAFCLLLGYGNADDIKIKKQNYMDQQKQIEDRMLVIKKELLDLE